MVSGCPGQYYPTVIQVVFHMAYGLVGGVSKPCQGFATSPEQLAKDLFNHMKTQLAAHQLIRHAQSADRPPLNLLPTIYVGARLWHVYIKSGANGFGPLSKFNKNPTNDLILSRVLSLISVMIELSEAGDFKFKCD